MIPSIKTRFLIVSDTHGMNFSPEDRPMQHVDVAIHCGDLTDGSRLEEFRTTIQLMKDIDAPLKLVIAGNHDLSLDIPAFERKVAEAQPPLESILVVREYGAAGEARRLLEDAKERGIIFLDEGIHSFVLENGALLTVYASPYTPSLGAWGFQYHQDRGHDFNITEGVDVVVTHGPPKGIMDYTYGRERAGCAHLFAAVARCRPLLHCFGHIHEGWGAKLVTWKETFDEEPSHFTAIDNDESHVIEKLASLKVSKFDTPEDIEQKSKKLERYGVERCCTTSHCAEDELPLKKAEQTLFVNASIADSNGLATQRPWLIETELAKAENSGT